MTYREHRAPPALAPWLACTWERRDGGGPPIRVVPDGCIDIVWTQGAGAQVVGPNTTAFLVALDAGVHVVGARMRPGAAPALLARVLRLARALAAARAGDELALASYAAGYADQAHFAHDCRALAGVSATALV